MIKVTTVTEVHCDACGTLARHSDYATIGKVDVCKKCLIEAYEAHMRLNEGMVKGRRGWRYLGEIDT